jgi:hypothetical protein
MKDVAATKIDCVDKPDVDESPSNEFDIQASKRLD